MRGTQEELKQEQNEILNATKPDVNVDLEETAADYMYHCGYNENQALKAAKETLKEQLEIN